MTDTRQLYQEYHENCPFDDFGTHTFQGEKAMRAYANSRSVLDFGCGNGHAVRKMRAAGHDWHGVEYSEAAYEKYLSEPYFHVGGLDRFTDDQFDMVYSTEVFEHIPEEAVDETVSHLCRIAAKYLFMTISLRPSSQNNRFHCTLKGREWWEERFQRCGVVVDRPVVDCFQPRTLKTTRGIMKKWAGFGPDAKAFCEHPPYELQGEKEFWFFAFRRQGVPAQPLPTPTQPWSRRTLIPLARKALRLDPVRRAA